MAGRKIGWEDQSITGGFKGANKERQFKGEIGVTYIIRVMTECEEYRVHVVDDVREPDKNGEPQVFNMICSKTWDSGAEDWTGECEGCERDYVLNNKYISGVLVVGSYKGRSKVPQKIDPANAAHYWPFGGDKYRKLSDIALTLSRAKKPRTLKQVELEVSCEDETFQKLNIQISQGEALTTRAHIEAWNEEGPKLLEEATKPPTIAEQKRNLKKRKPAGGRTDDAGEDDEPLPAKGKSKAAKTGGKPVKKTKAAEPEEPEEEPEESGEESAEEDLDALLEEI